MTTTEQQQELEILFDLKIREVLVAKKVVDDYNIWLEAGLQVKSPQPQWYVDRMIAVLEDKDNVDAIRELKLQQLGL
jgi:hypothetical protein